MKNASARTGEARHPSTELPAVTVLGTRWAFLLALLLLGPLALAGPQALAATLQVRFLGHACFLLGFPNGTKVLIDPFDASLGYAQPSVSADLVTVSHRHFDHMNESMASGTPRVLHGVSPDKQFVALRELVAGVAVRTVPTWHDRVQGVERGPNAVFVFEAQGIRIAHLGDLGHPLDEAQIRAIGPLDLLFVPVGGTFTLDARGARDVVRALRPRFVIPMHHRASGLRAKLPLQGPEPFLRGQRVRKVGSSTELAFPVPGKGVEVLFFDLP